MDNRQQVFDSEMMTSLNKCRWCESLESLKVLYFELVGISSLEVKVEVCNSEKCESVMFCRKVKLKFFISSDRSTCSDDGLLYSHPQQHPLFQIFTQSLDAIDVTSVTLRHLNSINAVDVIRYLGHILGISRAYLGHI